MERKGVRRKGKEKKEGQILKLGIETCTFT